ncbi:MAG: phage virion morphogenesis protein [Magnetococcus sp. THC-1_WYH]
MAGITLTVDQSGLDHLFGVLTQAADDLTPAMSAIGEYLITATQDRFDLQQDPQGAAWSPLSSATKDRKRIDKILTESSRLRDSISYQASPNEVRVGTNVIYAAIHQLGGETGRGHSVTIPARPYLGLSETDLDHITETVRDYLTQTV